MKAVQNGLDKMDTDYARFANTLTFAFMHHHYLVCIIFGMPSLHLFTFLMFFFLFSCFYTFLISVTARPNSKKSILLIFFHMKLTTVLRQLHDHPSTSKG